MNLHHIVLAIAVQVAHKNRIIVTDRGQHRRLKGAIAVAQYYSKRKQIGTTAIGLHHAFVATHMVAYQAEQVLFAIAVEVAQVRVPVIETSGRNLSRADKTWCRGREIVRCGVRDTSRCFVLSRMAFGESRPAGVACALAFASAIARLVACGTWN